MSTPAPRPMGPAAAWCLAVVAACASGSDLPPEQSLPVAVQQAATITATPTFLQAAADRAVARLAELRPEGYPILLPHTSHYDPDGEVAIGFGPAEGHAVVLAAGMSPGEVDSLAVDLLLDDVALDVAAHDSAGLGSCMVAVALRDVVMRFDLRIARNKLGKTEAVAHLPATLDATPWIGPLDGCEAIGLGGLAPLVASRALDAAREQLTTSFVATIAPTLREVLPFRLPPGRRVTQQSPGGDPGSMSERLTPSASADGSSVLVVQGALVSMGADLALSSARNTCVPDLPIDSAPATEPPGVPPTVPGTGAPYDVALSLSVSALKQAVAHAWRAGLFCESVGSTQAEGLTAATFAPWLPDIEALANSNPVWLRFWPAASPTVTFNDEGAGPGGLSVHLFFPQIQVELYADVEETRLLLYRLTGAVSLGTHPVLGAPTSLGAPLELLVDTVATDGVVVTSPLVDGPVAAEQELAAQLWETAIGALLGKTEWLALPVTTWEPELLSAVSVGGTHATLFLRLGKPGGAPVGVAPGLLRGLSTIPGEAPPWAGPIELPPMGPGSAWRADGRLWRSLAGGAMLPPSARAGLHVVEIRAPGAAAVPYYWLNQPAPPEAASGGCTTAPAAPGALWLGLFGVLWARRGRRGPRP
ncbi:MAG: hypothetical protein AMXMBFR64_28960 [Myxococcales bacterium]